MLRPTTHAPSLPTVKLCSGQVASVLLRIWPKKISWNISKNWEKFPCQSCGTNALRLLLQETCLSLTVPLSDLADTLSKGDNLQKKTKKPNLHFYFPESPEVTAQVLVRFRYSEATCVPCTVAHRARHMCSAVKLQSLLPGNSRLGDAPVLTSGLRWHTDPKPTEEWHSFIW